MTLPWKKGPPREGEAGEWVVQLEGDRHPMCAHRETADGVLRWSDDDCPVGLISQDITHHTPITPPGEAPAPPSPREGGEGERRSFERAVLRAQIYRIASAAHCRAEPYEPLINTLVDEVMARVDSEAKLRAFARDVMGEWPHENGVDGFQLQDLAVKHGLLVPVTMTSPCGEGCQCAEYYESDELAEGVTCYRKTELLLPGEGT